MADIDLKKEYQERFAQLPKVVQDAITSANISNGLRKLSEQNKLHVDQWDKLENEVMFALLGFEDAANLPQNIAKNVGVTDEMAATLAQQISSDVFEPIREQLDRELGSPEAKEEELTDVEKVREDMLRDAGVTTAPPAADTGIPAPASATIAETPSVQASIPPPPTVVPGTPPATAPEQKVVRAPISESYHAQNPSTERKTIDGDPYREPVK